MARQAIVSANQEIVGYELLVQDSGKDVIAQDAIDEATSRLFVESQLELGFENLVGIHKAFINFSERSLLENFPLAFDKSKIIVEIMGSVKPTARVMRACSLLRTKGYKLSLDDGLLRSQWSEHGNVAKNCKSSLRISQLVH